MKVLAVVLLAFTLVFVRAGFTVAQTHGKNNATFKENKIVGGLVTDISRVPSQVAILQIDKMICSGHIIDPKIVLTAGHCLINRNVELLKIRSGSNYHGMLGRVVGVIKVTIHPNFEMCEESLKFDIAVMFLESSATALGIPARPIVLWHTGAIFYPGTLATLSGWGSTKESTREPSPLLRSVSLPIVALKECVEEWEETLPIHTICAGYSAGGRDGCWGDSGAGLVILDKLAAINSFSDGCAQPLVPAIFSSVPEFRHWIWQETGI